MEFDRTWTTSVDPREARLLATDARRRTAGFVDEGARDVEVSVGSRDEAEFVRVRRDIPTGADRAGAALVGRFLRSVQTELWQPVDADGAVSAQLHVVFPGRPMSVRASLHLIRTPTGGEQTVSGVVTARLPGVGRLVERRVVRGLLASMTEQWRSSATD